MQLYGYKIYNIKAGNKDFHNYSVRRGWNDTLKAESIWFIYIYMNYYIAKFFLFYNFLTGCIKLKFMVLFCCFL